MRYETKEEAVKFLKNRVINSKTPKKIFISTYKVNKNYDKRDLSIYIWDGSLERLDDISALVGAVLDFKVKDYPDRYTVIRHGVGFNVHLDLAERLSEVLGTKLDYQSI